MAHSFFLVAKAIAFVTGFLYVLMMVVYFKSGPKHNAERFMSTTMLVATVLHATLVFNLKTTSFMASILSLALLFFSNLLFWSARVAHGKTRPAAVFGEAVPEAFVSSGPYRFVRHPFYLSYVLTFLATATMSGNSWLYLSSTIIFALYNLAARQEEKLLATSPSIGTKYVDYCQHSSRWFPKVW
jgi:protein-S-isoprenylcysteine O-methyltransferase Ste14